MDFEEAVNYMSGLIRFGWKLGNDRMVALCERLGNPQDRYAVVHVAGTKGKGSATALAAAILRAQGYNVGAYFSPYVYDVRERVQVNGAMIPEADFARLVTQIRPHIEAVAETEHGQTTEFELKTALAFMYFAERNVDFACIEVGIGGRLDATNIVKPSVTVITNIGLDHTDILGETYAEIAREKAGIIKPGIPCITATQEETALTTIEQIAYERIAPLIYVRRTTASEPTRNPRKIRWEIAHNTATPQHLDTRADDFAPLNVATEKHLYANLSLRMGGLYQRENAACAIGAAETALAQRGETLSLEAVRVGLGNTALPGRLTVVRLQDGPLVVLDGAHNELAARALAGPIAALKPQHGIKRTLLVIGMVGGHSPDGVLQALAPGAERIHACQPQWKRAQPAEAIAAAATAFTPNVRSFETVEAAVRSALADADPDTLVLITGSFYTVGEVPMDKLEAWAGNELHHRLDGQ